MQDYQIWASRIIEKVKNKMEWVSAKTAPKYLIQPDEGGNYDDRSAEDFEWGRDDGINWWTNGFWGGIMWLLYQDTHDERYAVQEFQRESWRSVLKCIMACIMMWVLCFSLPQ